MLIARFVEKCQQLVAEGKDSELAFEEAAKLFKQGELVEEKLIVSAKQKMLIYTLCSLFNLHYTVITSDNFCMLHITVHTILMKIYKYEESLSSVKETVVQMAKANGVR